MKGKINSLTKGRRLIILSALFHFFGVVVTFFFGGKKLPNNFDFNLFLHLLRFFSWWSVHTSILTIWAAIISFREKKKPPSYFSQLITLLAVIYNLTTLVFWLYCLFFLRQGMWEESWFLNVQSVIWHLVAPLLTILYFYFSAQINLLREKKVKTLFFASFAPIFYFFYVYVLAKINHPTSSLFPYMKKYPYRIFEWIAERKWSLLIINFLTACAVYFSLCYSIIWIKSITAKKRKDE